MRSRLRKKAKGPLGPRAARGALVCCLAAAPLACGKSPAPPAADATPPAATPLAPSILTVSPPPAVTAPDNDPPPARALRQRLVDEIRASGPPWGGAAWDPRVLDALLQTPRHLFVPGAPLSAAYEDRPQPIGHGQTISQPTVVAIMTDALDLTGNERVLEVGTGSGYQAAVLALLSQRVYSIELLAPLGEMARDRLAKLGYSNVEVRVGDGYAGWPERAPFDRVIITAAPPEIPRALVEQLADGGILVAPVGDGHRQKLVRWTKRGANLQKEDLGDVMFVPLVPGTGSP
jgi:protein-L-isoaspartate(D-aspartate) O-methyltransferase